MFTQLTLVPVTLSDFKNVNHLVLSEDVGDLYLLNDVVTGKVTPDCFLPCYVA